MSILRRAPDPTAKSDMHWLPAESINRALLGILRLENELIARGVRLPWGSSLFAVGRKA